MRLQPELRPADDLMSHLKHARQGQRFVYFPATSQAKVRHSATKRLLNTFFGGAVEKAVIALFEASDIRLLETELDRIETLIQQARKNKK